MTLMMAPKLFMIFLSNITETIRQRFTFLYFHALSVPSLNKADSDHASPGLDANSGPMAPGQ